MDNFFNLDSPVMSALSRMADLIIANILFIITSIPIITLGASTTALYTVVRTPGEKQYSSSVFKNYFKAFGNNFKKSTLIFLLLLIPAAIVVINLYILLVGLLENSIVNYIICAIPIVILLLVWNYIFPLTACFENSIRRTFANAFVLSVAHLPTTIVVTVLNLLPAVMFIFFTEFFFKTLIIWVFIGFALITKVTSLLLDRVFARYANAAPAEA